MAPLLSFHKTILEKIHDPSTSELLLISRGIGLRRIVCKLLQIYDSPQNLVFLVNASQDEQSAIGEELGVMGCRDPGLRMIEFETGRKDRQDLYKRGGLFSVTSQIFTVDMLYGDIPIHLITGILVLHAEKVTITSPVAFIVRLYREKNQTGFLKAFSDQPEHITNGLSPLKNVMKELQIRTVHIYPRFHVDVKACLDKKQPDVIEIHQHMTDAMREIHHAIVQCMTITLSELKRTSTDLDTEDLNVDEAYFKDFDHRVRRVLDKEWHKVGLKARQLMNDIHTLRELLEFLLRYDAVKFQNYLDHLVASNTVNEQGNARVHQSPWMLTDAAHTIFEQSKRRCYTIDPSAKRISSTPAPRHDEDEEEWAILDELERNDGTSNGASKNESMPKRPSWLPPTMNPVLEELPKWTVLADVLQEIEEETMRRQSQLTALSPGTNTVLIMSSSAITCEELSDFLSQMDSTSPRGQQGRKMMMKHLRLYLSKKAEATKQESHTQGKSNGSRDKRDDGISEALQKKDRERRERAANRRRIRGGAPAATLKDAGRSGSGGHPDTDEAMALLSQNHIVLEGAGSNDQPMVLDIESTFDDYYGLLVPEQTVVLRKYHEDSDDQMLQEIQPRFIVLYEPSLEFIRRVEVYRNSNPGLGVRVYFLQYHDSSEEVKYLRQVRREKESFERLIKDRGRMLMPIFEERRSGSSVNDSLIKTISSRIAGGRKDVTIEPSRVIVDLREFRSSLPSLLHAAQVNIVPATLTIGDYILTPDICVERKSIRDLISSFNSGRLYTQCEMMSTHYKQPVLLIEFEENKSFSFEAFEEAKSLVKGGGKQAVSKKSSVISDGPPSVSATIQSKLVLLTLTFPRVRIIWSSSPYATADVFQDLKLNSPEPDVDKAILIGAEDDPNVGAGVNAAAEELLRSLPGITAKNVKHVMSKVNSVQELCELSLREVQEILGVEPGKACWDFIHRGDRKRK
ncbi:hypothetical protein CERSUDRAFT_118713 [Gelatoporia subvermispora B]|uniref:ERCC4 domain-containing protein n=1 Tax=Ceriporiopsis subvermispora (strain B) TaxID=914234 RepID=M2QJP8_CERS8|nr:hypothetical protein CERSUDRAFT_118713 [Gelatoporia subvermispora B]